MFATMEKRPNSVNTAPGCREFTVTAFPILIKFLKRKRAYIVVSFSQNEKKKYVRMIYRGIGVRSVVRR